VLLVSGTHPSRNPRLVKEADLLAERGWEVSALQPVFDPSLEQEDRSLAERGGWKRFVYCDLSRRNRRSFFDRLVRWLANRAKAVGIATPESLGYGVRRACRIAQGHPARWLAGHQEVGLWVTLSSASRKRTIVDFEDWYSRDLPESVRPAEERRLLSHLEGKAIRSARSATTSQALAEALAEEYKAEIPTVIYNTFPRENASEAISTQNLRLVWISQTIGPNRGLELLWDALNRMGQQVDLTLIGESSPQFEANLIDSLPAHVQLKLMRPVPNAEIDQTLRSFDVGLALEQPYCANRELTVTNKFFHYLIADLDVIATDTQGQREVADLAPKRIRLVPPDDPESLAQSIKRLTNRRTTLRDRPTTPLPNELCWPENAERLLRLYES